ncbi:MAG: DUF362 domain-containing protein [Chloroflexi bacterium]|nr:DUF362 domain-containing protein [Chloroflexota bacterium]
MLKHRVTLIQAGHDLARSVWSALAGTGLLDLIKSSTRIALKPNLTYPFHKPGVTTSPPVIRETVKILREYTPHIAVVETDGGYGAWQASEAFAGHGLYQLRDEFGLEIVNLNDEARELIAFRSGRQEHHLPLATRLLHETDVFITMPVPKIHCMTGLTLSYKNQWGCVPDVMRLRRHYLFDDAIVAINRALKPAVLADGTYFLDHNGPMEGDPIRMDLVIAATDAGAFDRYVSELMGFSWRRVRHLRRAAELGDMPSRLEDIHYNVSPSGARTHTFRLERSLRNYIALAGFNSRFLTWLGYESWFGRVLLHTILYAIAGKPVKPHSPGASEIE